MLSYKSKSACVLLAMITLMALWFVPNPTEAAETLKKLATGCYANFVPYPPFAPYPPFSPYPPFEPYPPFIPLTASITANGSDSPGPLPYGSNVTVTWTSAGASSCTVTSPAGTWSGVGGTVTISLTSTTKFDLACED